MGWSFGSYPGRKISRVKVVCGQQLLYYAQLLKAVVGSFSKNEPFADAGGVLRHLSVAVVEHDGSSGYRVSIFAMCKAPDWSWDHLSRCTKLMDSSMLGVGVEACGFAVLTQ